LSFAEALFMPGEIRAHPFEHTHLEPPLRRALEGAHLIVTNNHDSFTRTSEFAREI